MKCTSSRRGSISRETALSVDVDRHVHRSRASCCRARAVARRSARGGQHAGQMALVVDRAAAVGERRAILGGDLAGLREQLVGRRRAAQQLGRRGRGGPSSGRRRSARRRPSMIVPPSIQTAAEAAAIAQSPARRSTFSWALPAPGRSGSRTSVSSSPSPTAVMYGPKWNVVHVDDPLALEPRRSPPGPERRADGAEVLGRVGLAQRAADGAAVAHHRVGDHLLGVARRSGSGAASTSERSSSTWRVSAPIRTSSARLADVGQLGEVVDVDQVLGVGQPQLHHRQQAVAAGDDPCSPSCLASDAIAPSTLVARSYSNGAGVCTLISSFPAAGRGHPLARTADRPRRGSYWIGESVPITGERGSALRPRLAHVGIQPARRAGCRRPDCAAPGRWARRRRSAPRGRAGPASACPWCRPRRSAAA